MTKEKKSHMVNVRMTDSMKAELVAAAKISGRSLSGEIQFKLLHYQFMLEIRDKLLKNL